MIEIQKCSSLDLLRIFAHRLIINESANFRPHKKGTTHKALLPYCSSNEDKAKRAVKDYLKENLDNFKSYEPVSWGNLREFFIDSIKQNDSYYQEHLHSANEALKRSKEY